MQLNLTNVMPVAAYAEQRDHVFQTPQSLEWFIRVNRDELVQRRALLMIAGRRQVDATRFDEAVLDIGAKLAQRPHGKAA